MDEQQGQQGEPHEQGEPQGPQGQQPPPGEHPEAPKVDLDPSAPAQYGSVPPQEIADGKAFAILSYAILIIQLPFFVVPLIMRNNDFSLFHAKQSLILAIAWYANWVIALIFSWTCFIPVICAVIAVALIVLLIIGIINSVNGQFKPLPVIGPYAEKWFAGIKKVPSAS